MRDQLAPADRLSLDTPVQAARYDQLADQWIDRESKADGLPLARRLETDPAPPMPCRRRIPKATDARQLAFQEPFLQAFAQASPDRQQKLIDLSHAGSGGGRGDLPWSVRRLWHQHCSRACVNSPFPIEAANDDIETEHLLDAIYGVDQPGLASEPTDGGLLHQVQAVEDNRRQGDAGEDAEVARLKRIDPDAKIARRVRIDVAGGPDYMVADIIFRETALRWSTSLKSTSLKSRLALLFSARSKSRS